MLTDDPKNRTKNQWLAKLVVHILRRDQGFQGRILLRRHNARCRTSNEINRGFVRFLGKINHEPRSVSAQKAAGCPRYHRRLGSQHADWLTAGLADRLAGPKPVQFGGPGPKISSSNKDHGWHDVAQGKKPTSDTTASDGRKFDLAAPAQSCWHLGRRALICRLTTQIRTTGQ